MRDLTWLGKLNIWGNMWGAYFHYWWAPQTSHHGWASVIDANMRQSFKILSFWYPSQGDWDPRELTLVRSGRLQLWERAHTWGKRKHTRDWSLGNWVMGKRQSCQPTKEPLRKEKVDGFGKPQWKKRCLTEIMSSKLIGHLSS